MSADYKQEVKNLFEDMIRRKKDPKEEKRKMLNNLYRPPQRERGAQMPHFAVPEPNEVHQLDLLTMPDDDGYKYILVAVDASSKKVDAVALKSKSAKEVLEGLKEIYVDGDILDIPKKFEVDNGSEFKGQVKEWMESEAEDVRVAKTARHRQQALVERENQTIQKFLFKRMSAEEVLTGEESTEWVDELQTLIEVLNRHRKPYVEPRDPKIDYEGDVLKIGTRVRVPLEQPVSAVGRKLGGRWRTGDLRWDTEKEYKVTEILIKPFQPPLYRVNDGSRVAYTIQQLQVVHDDERDPSVKLVKKPKGKYRVKKIIGHRGQGRAKQYHVRWYGFDQPTWEPAKTIEEDVPEMVQEYEDSI